MQSMDEGFFELPFQIWQKLKSTKWCSSSNDHQRQVTKGSKFLLTHKDWLYIKNRTEQVRVTHRKITYGSN